MELKEASISIYVNREKTTIELHDKTSSITFARVTLTPEQFSSALSRLSQTPCKIQVVGTEKLNRLLEVGKHEFELPEGLNRHDNIKGIYQLALETCPEGWIPDEYFGSQTSFFSKDGKTWGRVTIRRWVELPNPEVSDTTGDAQRTEP